MKINKKIIIFLSLIFIIAIIVSTAFFINKYLKLQKVNEEISLSYQNQFNLSKSEVDKLYNQFKDWKVVNQKILEKKYIFSSKELSEFLSQGYPQADIAKAQSYASRCDYTAETILKTRGLQGKRQLPWRKVIKKLKINTSSESELLGLTKEDKQILKEFNLSEQQLVNIAVLKLQKKLSVDNIFNKLKTGKTVEQIVEETKN